jgi:hypothetical protein
MPVTVLLNPFCFVRIPAISAPGFFLLLLQSRMLLAISGGLTLAAGGAALDAPQPCLPATA